MAKPHKAEAEWRAAGYATRSDIPPLTEPEAVAAARKLWRREFGAAVGGKPKRRKNWNGQGMAILYPPKRVEITSGNRRNDVRKGVLNVNPSAGWHDLIHDLSHEVHYRLNPAAKPHDRKQHVIEARMVRYAVAKGWLAGALRKPEKPVEPVAKVSLRDKRASRARASLARAEHRLKLAQAAVARLTKKVRYYDKPAPVRAPRPKAELKPRKPRMPRSAKGKALAIAAEWGITIDTDDMGSGACWWVLGPALNYGGGDGVDGFRVDPCEGDHFCTSWDEVLDKVQEYARDLQAIAA